MSEDTTGTPLVPSARRGTGSSSAEATPWARQRSAGDGERVTSRTRKLVQGLPAWEPMPPGEMVIRRPRHS